MKMPHNTLHNEGFLRHGSLLLGVPILIGKASYIRPIWNDMLYFLVNIHTFICTYWYNWQLPGIGTGKSEIKDTVNDLLSGMECRKVFYWSKISETRDTG